MLRELSHHVEADYCMTCGFYSVKLWRKWHISSQVVRGEYISTCFLQGSARLIILLVLSAVHLPYKTS